MELYSDIYYLKQIQEGKIECFACLLDKYSRQVYSMIVKIVENKEDAEELSQDVFIKVYRKLDSFNNECAFSTWLYRIAYNTAISYTRKKRYEFLVLEETLFHNIPEEEMEEFISPQNEADLIHLLTYALEKLPPDERGLIVLYYMKDKSIGEISFITGLSQSNVKTKLFRIRKKLLIILTNMEKTDYI